MLANTLTFTVNAVAKVLTRVKEINPSTSIYRLRETTGMFVATVKQSTYVDSKRGNKVVERASVELVHTIFPVAPATIPEIRKSYQVIEKDSDITDPTLARHISKSVSDFVGTAANADQLLGGEY